MANSRVPSPKDIPSKQGAASDAEWSARVDLAAAYRLVALFGWDDLIFTHISMRCPDEDGEPRFLINPYGLFFEEMTASSLVKVNFAGEIVDDTPYAVNPAGFTIHSAIHMARSDVHCVLHLHTDYGVAVSAQSEGLLPLSQNALTILDKVAYHDYEGIALDHDERERLVADLGDKYLMILRNHGTLAAAPTCSLAFTAIYLLERACKIQILAQAGDGLIALDPAMAARVAEQTNVQMLDDAINLVWPALLRRLDRENPGYDE